EPVVRVLAAEKLLGEVGEVGDVADDGLGDAPADVADDGSVAELEPEGDRGVDPVVEAGDDDHLRGRLGERPGGVVGGEVLVALEQGGHPGHGGCAPVKGWCHRLAVAGGRRPFWERYEFGPPWGVTQRCLPGGMSLRGDPSPEGATGPAGPAA